MKTGAAWTLMLAVVLLMGGAASAQDADEAARIRYLIASVESLPGATFIRNGAEYDARRAADHLRLKLRRAGDRVRTAEDFIRLCASRSSVSGEPYRLRFPDGRTLEAETFFRERLKAFPVPSRSAGPPHAA